MEYVMTSRRFFLTYVIILNYSKLHSREAFENMVPVWDSVEQREVLVRPYILFFPADNPMQAEECSSTGLRSNIFCRTCKVGGSNEHKLSDDGYSQLFQVRTTASSLFNFY
jgi:hypothetical protein